MFHQLLHCQQRIVAHRLARAFQQSGVPALRPGDGPPANACPSGSGMQVSRILARLSTQREQGLLRSIEASDLPAHLFQLAASRSSAPMIASSRAVNSWSIAALRKTLGLA